MGNDRLYPITLCENVSVFWLRPVYQYLYYDHVWVIYWNGDKTEMDMSERTNCNSKIAKKLQ